MVFSYRSKVDGKSNAEALARDLGEEVKQRIAVLDVQRMQGAAKIRNVKALCLKTAAQQRKEARNAALRVKFADKMLNVLPDL